MRIHTHNDKPNLPRKFHKDTTMEHHGQVYRIVRKLPPQFTLAGLEKLVEQGQIQSYCREGSEFVVYTSNPEMLDLIAGLPQNRLPHPWLEKAKEVFLPPNMEENVAKEYLTFRGWALGASVAASAISFCNLSVTMDATHIALGTTEKIVLAQTINTYAARLTSMGASFLGQKGDQDPRRYYTINNLVATSNSALTLSLLSMIPKSYVPLSFSTAVAGAMASSLGSASNVNIFNHMAKNNKGLVQSKNSVQDLTASMMGAPVALGIRWAANKVGLPPALATVGILGPVQFFCSMNAASKIRMQPMQRRDLEKLSDGFLKDGAMAEAPRPGMWENIKSAVVGHEAGESSANIQAVEKLDDLVQGNQDPQHLFSTFRSDRYMVSFDAKAGAVRLALRRDAPLEDVFKAYSQGRFLEMAQAKLYGAVLELVGEAAAPNALVELAHRGLGQPVGAAQVLSEQGWHTSMLSLGLNTVQAEWKGEAKEPLPPVTREELMQLCENPNKDRLSYLLGVSNSPPPSPSRN